MREQVQKKDLLGQWHCILRIQTPFFFIKVNKAWIFFSIVDESRPPSNDKHKRGKDFSLTRLRQAILDRVEYVGPLQCTIYAVPCVITCKCH